MIIKYPGGKSKVAPKIKYPDCFDTYVEPFLGGGSVFFHLAKNSSIPKDALIYLSDTNSHIVNLYNQIIGDPHGVIELVECYGKNHDEQQYYTIRRSFNEGNGKHGVVSAAQFLYMNRMSFNGLIRFNKSGKFNVPYGKRKFSFNPDLVHLASDLLKQTGAIVYKRDFRDTFPEGGEKIFAYFDPPYPEKFSNYGRTGFSVEDHDDLFDLLVYLDKRDVKWCLSYPRSHAWKYNDLGNVNMDEIETRTSIGATTASRGAVPEVLIYNY